MSYKRTFAALLLVSITVLGALGAAGTRIDFVGGTTGTTTRGPGRNHGRQAKAGIALPTKRSKTRTDDFDFI